MATYTLIDSEVLASSQASVTFSAIPSTFTDIVVRASIRTNNASAYDSVYLKFNGSSSGYSRTALRGNGAAASSSRASSQAEANLLLAGDADTATANTFSSLELYIPSYTASQNKPFSSISMQEDNTTTAFIYAMANLWSNTAAITSMVFTPESGTSFLTGSSFYLYGISNA
jgi:hypothetical protein